MAALVLFGAGAAVTAAPASAEVWQPPGSPGWWDSLSALKRQAITNNMLRAQGYSAMTYQIAPGHTAPQNYFPERVAQQTWAAETRAPAQTGGYQRAWASQQIKARVRSGVLPKLTSALGSGATRTATKVCPAVVGAIVCTFSLGWTIGTGISQLWIENDVADETAEVAGASVMWSGVSTHYGSLGGWATAPTNGSTITAPPQSLLLSRSLAGGAGTRVLSFDSEVCPSSYRLGNGNLGEYTQTNGTIGGYCTGAVLPAHAWYLGQNDAIADWIQPTAYSSSLNSQGIAQPFPALPSTPGVVEPALEAWFDSPAGTFDGVMWRWIFENSASENDPVWDAPAPGSGDDPEVGSADSPTSPVTGQATVPDCDGMTYALCVDELRSAGFLGTITDAPTDFAGADMEIQAARWLASSPAEGTLQPFTQPITVITNPDLDHMPVPMPNWIGQPLPAEAERPLPTTVTELPENNPDVRFGPGEVTESSPEPGTKLAPTTWPAPEPLPDGAPTTATVTTNPLSAPVPGAPGGLFTPPEVPPIDLSPLSALTPCSVFPFGIPCWVKDALDEWVGSPVTPEWTFVFPFGGDFTVDLAVFDPYMGPIRAVLLFLAICSMTWLFVGLAYGSISGGKSEKD